MIQASVKRAGRVLLQRASDDRSVATMDAIKERCKKADWHKLQGMAGESTANLKVRMSEVVNLNHDVKRMLAMVSVKFLQDNATAIEECMDNLASVNIIVEQRKSHRFWDDVMRLLRDLELALESHESLLMGKLQALKTYANAAKAWQSSIISQDFTADARLASAIDIVVEKRKAFMTLVQDPRLCV